MKLIDHAAIRTVHLVPISGDGALKTCRELSVKWRQTHNPHRCWLLRAAPVSPSDLQQCCSWKANTNIDAVHESPHSFIFPLTHAVQTYTPMSLLLLELSKFGWIISFSTEKICSFFALVSLVAFFPRCTESMSMSLLSKCQEENISGMQKKNERHHCSRRWGVFVVSPIKTVCSSNNPARRDERTTTKETMAKNSSNPRLWLYSHKRTVHNFVGPLFRPLTTWQLCRDKQDEFREEQTGKTTSRRTLPYLCPVQWAGVLL